LPKIDLDSSESKEVRVRDHDNPHPDIPPQKKKKKKTFPSARVFALTLLFIPESLSIAIIKVDGYHVTIANCAHNTTTAARPTPYIFTTRYRKSKFIVRSPEVPSSKLQTPKTDDKRGRVIIHDRNRLSPPTRVPSIWVVCLAPKTLSAWPSWLLGSKDRTISASCWSARARQTVV
jgi:hypothetical protein